MEDRTQKDFLKRLNEKQIRTVDYILTDKYIKNLKQAKIKSK